jgi:hypothetical protein
LVEQGVEFLLVAQWQTDGQVQALRAREITDGYQARRRWRDVLGAEHLAFCCLGNQRQNRGQERN